MEEQIEADEVDLLEKELKKYMVLVLIDGLQSLFTPILIAKPITFLV